MPPLPIPKGCFARGPRSLRSHADHQEKRRPVSLAPVRSAFTSIDESSSVWRELSVQQNAEYVTSFDTPLMSSALVPSYSSSGDSPSSDQLTLFSDSRDGDQTDEIIVSASPPHLRLGEPLREVCSEKVAP